MSVTPDTSSPAASMAVAGTPRKREDESSGALTPALTRTDFTSTPLVLPLTASQSPPMVPDLPSVGKTVRVPSSSSLQEQPSPKVPPVFS